MLVKGVPGVQHEDYLSWPLQIEHIQEYHWLSWLVTGICHRSPRPGLWIIRSSSGNTRQDILKPTNYTVWTKCELDAMCQVAEDDGKIILTPSINCDWLNRLVLWMDGDKDIPDNMDSLKSPSQPDLSEEVMVFWFHVCSHIRRPGLGLFTNMV